MNTIELRELAAAIAVALGGKLDETEERWTQIKTKQGATLSMHEDSGRLKVRPSWPRYKDPRECCTVTSRQLSTDEEQRDPKFITDITVNAARAPADIARDIERRLMPAVSVLYPRAVAHVERRAKEQSDHADAVTALAKAVGGSVSTHDKERIHVAGCPALRVSSPNSVHIEAMYVSPKVAAQIVRLVQKSKGEA